jgi:hypothetical protein
MVSRFLLLVVALLAALAPSSSDAFVPTHSAVSTCRATTAAFVFGKKKVEDLSDIEVRDMTRQEMLDLNAKNEDIMNMELSVMTGFSVVVSLPILYLCWVAFFSD